MVWHLVSGLKNAPVIARWTFFSKFWNLPSETSLWALGPKYGQIWGFLVVLTPQMAISHLVMTIGVGISQKKYQKFLPPLTMYKYCGMTHIQVICWGLFWPFRPKQGSRSYLGTSMQLVLTIWYQLGSFWAILWPKNQSKSENSKKRGPSCQFLRSLTAKL